MEESNCLCDVTDQAVSKAFKRAVLVENTDWPTRAGIERVQIELWRKASPAKRFAIMASWSHFITEVAKQGIRRDYPEADEQEVALMLLARQHGQELADRVRAYLAKRKNNER